MILCVYEFSFQVFQGEFLHEYIHQEDCTITLSLCSIIVYGEVTLGLQRQVGSIPSLLIL